MFLLFLFTNYKNEQKQHKFRRQKNQKSDFYKNKKIFNIDDIDVNKILVSKKEQYGKYNSFKYFIGHNDNDVTKPLVTSLKVTMSLKVKDKKRFKNYNKIWKKNCKNNGHRF